MPNGEGTLVLSVTGGGKIRLEARPIFTAEDGKGAISEGESVKRLAVQFRPVAFNLDERGAGLLGAKGLFYSYRFPKMAPPPTPIIQKIYDDLDRVRATQQIMSR